MTIVFENDKNGLRPFLYNCFLKTIVFKKKIYWQLCHRLLTKGRR